MLSVLRVSAAGHPLRPAFKQGIHCHKSVGRGGRVLPDLVPATRTRTETRSCFARIARGACTPARRCARIRPAAPRPESAYQISPQDVERYTARYGEASVAAAAPCASWRLRTGDTFMTPLRTEDRATAAEEVHSAAPGALCLCGAVHAPWHAFKHMLRVPFSRPSSSAVRRTLRTLSCRDRAPSLRGPASKRQRRSKWLASTTVHGSHDGSWAVSAPCCGALREHDPINTTSGRGPTVPRHLP
jgi:hypothetical protein